LPEPKNKPTGGHGQHAHGDACAAKGEADTTRRPRLTFASVSLPKQLRETKVVKDKSADDIAREIVEWIKK